MTTSPPSAPSQDSARVAVVMMCEPAAYEWQAVLLTSSLLSYGYGSLTLYAYCRRSLAHALHPRTRAFFDRHGVHFDVIDPAFRVNYPQGNKLFAAAMPRPQRKTVFIDTDVMLTQPTLLAEAFFPGAVSGRPTARWMWGDTAQAWAPAYRAAGLPVTPRRMPQIGQGTTRYVPPSLNAGFVAWDEGAFSTAWRDVAQKIEADPSIADIFPTLDQIALPIAAETCGLGLRFLDKSWNASAEFARTRPAQVRVLHYQNLAALRASGAVALADQFLRDHAGFDSLADLVGFYAENGQKPPQVKNAPGHIKPADLDAHRLNQAAPAAALENR
ncbi:MAG: hypothetical protein AAF281_14340 [Pseudomonadota bacterium]